MGKQMVRCPREDRVAVPSAMIHLLSYGTVDHGRFVSSRQHGTARPPKFVTVRKERVPDGLEFCNLSGRRAYKAPDRHFSDQNARRNSGAPRQGDHVMMELSLRTECRSHGECR